MLRPFHVTAFLGITIDGYIARADGSIDYLPPPPPSSPRSGTDLTSARIPTIDDMLNQSDVLILGRNTYEVALRLLSEDEKWCYGNVPILVLTSRTHETFGLELKANVTLVKDFDDAFSLVKEKGWVKVWVDGGKTVRGLLERGLLDEMVLTTVPIVLGNGLGLFAGLKREINCDIMAVEKTGEMVGVRYKVVY